ncbi:MAG: MFS transporter [Promethearchaeota archaeon]
MEKEEIVEFLPRKTKIAYGSANTASNILSGIGLSAITFFYNVKLGLSAELIGIAWLIFAAWNAINDPLFGILEDKTKTKMGRRIPYIRFGAPVYGFLFILCWFPLVNISNEIALFAYFLLMLFLFDTIFTIIGLITYSLPAEMALTARERASLMVYSTFIGAIGYIVQFIFPILFLTGDNSTEVDPNFYIAMIVIGVSCSLVLFISSYFLKENEFTQMEEALGFLDAIKETLKNKPFLILEVGVFVLLITSTILTSAIFYYVDYVLQLSGFLTVLPLLLIFATIFIFTYIFSKLVAKKGPKKISIFGLVFSALSLILLYFIGWDFSTAIIGFFLIGIGLSAVMLTSQILFADTIDYDETRTGKRRETTYSGVEALLTKPAISIANWMFLTIISSFGFEEGSIAQSNSALLGIMIGFTIIPAIFALFGAFVMKFFPLDGPEWNEQKLKISHLHEQKEKEYLEYLKKLKK